MLWLTISCGNQNGLRYIFRLKYQQIRYFVEFKTFIDVHVQVRSTPQCNQTFYENKLASMDKKNNLKQAFTSELRLNNRYECLQDEEIMKYTEINLDGNDIDRMFNVGSRSIFSLRRRRAFLKLRKSQVSKDFKSDPSSSIDDRSIKMKKANSLGCFETLNRFELLRDNPEDIIENIINRSYIVTATKRSLKKCRT